MGGKHLQVTATVPASREVVFALLADPARHVELDGAGMLRGLDSGPRPLTGVGDAFIMNMHQDGLGDYQMRNEVTAFEAPRKIAWAPDIHPRDALAEVFGALDPCGQRYIWELESLPGGGTQVTHTYDWSQLRDKSAEPLYPVVTEQQMRSTIENIERASTQPG